MGYGVFEGWKSERGQREVCPLSETTSGSEPAKQWSETSAGDRSAPGVHSQTYSKHSNATPGTLRLDGHLGFPYRMFLNALCVFLFDIDGG